MFGEEYNAINDEIVDMVGEIVNMISGDARKELEKLDFKFVAGIPSMEHGKDHILDHTVNERVIVIPFATKSGEFFIETSFDSEKFL